MRPWAAPSLADCCAPLWLPWSSSPRSLASYTDDVILRPSNNKPRAALNQVKRELRKRMTPSEETVTSIPEPEMIEVQTKRLSPDGFHSRPGTRRRTAILVAAAAVAVLAVLIYSGIHSPTVAASRLPRRTKEAPVATHTALLSTQTAPPQQINL